MALDLFRMIFTLMKVPENFEYKFDNEETFLKSANLFIRNT